LVKTGGTDHLACTNLVDGRTTYMIAAGGGTDVHLECLKIIMDRHLEKCGPYHFNQLKDPLKKTDNNQGSFL